MTWEGFCKEKEEHRLYHAIGEFCPCFSIEGGRVVMPIFEMSDNPSISLVEIKKRRFNIVKRAAEVAKQHVQDEIDKIILDAIDALN